MQSNELFDGTTLEWVILLTIFILFKPCYCIILSKDKINKDGKNKNVINNYQMDLTALQMSNLTTLKGEGEKPNPNNFWTNNFDYLPSA